MYIKNGFSYTSIYSTWSRILNRNAFQCPAVLPHNTFHLAFCQEPGEWVTIRLANAGSVIIIDGGYNG